jgi:hypothetical protein
MKLLEMMALYGSRRTHEGHGRDPGDSRRSREAPRVLGRRSESDGPSSPVDYANSAEPF